MLNNKKRIIFSDVDGTIYSHHNQKWAETTESSIKQAMLDDIEFVVCTGNPYYDRMQNLHNKINNQYFIGSSGAIILDIWNNKVIDQFTIDDEVAKEIFDLSNEYELSLHWWNREGIYGNLHLSDYIINFLSKYVSKDVPAKRINELHDNIEKMEFNIERTEDNIKKLDKMISQINKSTITLNRISDTHLEITSKDASKGQAALALLKHLNYKNPHIMTIGDSANDHSMFEITDFSFAMDNAPLETKKLARHITKHVEEDGLGYAIDIFKKMTE